MIGAVVIWRGGLFGLNFGDAARPVAYALWGLGALSALFSLVAPKANQALFVTLVTVTYPIGFVVSHVVLALLFFRMQASIRPRLPASGLEESVDERRRSATAQEDERAQRQHHDDDGQQPPLLIVFQKVPKLRGETRAIRFRELGDVILL